MKVLLGVTGSVAAIKTYKLTKKLLDDGHEVRVVITEKGEFFAKRGCECEEWYGINHYVRRDEDEWKWSEVGDKVMHIDLKDWANVLVIAPLTANTLAKMINGLCDNLLTCIYRAWPVKGKHIVVAPAMNTDMWEHPLTYRQLATLTDRHAVHVQPFDYFHVVRPVEKKLACGTTGVGAMAPVDEIVETVRKYGGKPSA